MDWHSLLTVWLYSSKLWEFWRRLWELYLITHHLYTHSIDLLSLQNLPFLFKFLVFDPTFTIFSSRGQKCWLGGSFKLIDLMSKTWPSPAASETSWKLYLAFTLNLKFVYILMHESNTFCSKKTVLKGQLHNWLKYWELWNIYLKTDVSFRFKMPF